MKIKTIKGTIEMADGTSAAFEIDADYGTQMYRLTPRTSSRYQAALGAVSAVSDALKDADIMGDELPECEGHESLDGPIGSVVYCDATCQL